MTTTKQKKAKTRKESPKPINRFPLTRRIEAYERALEYGLHLVRDNHHLWAVRTPRGDSERYDHVWICSSKSYDGLWPEAVNTFRDPDFDPEKLPYATEETDNYVTMYDPRDGSEFRIDKKDLRSRRGD